MNSFIKTARPKGESSLKGYLNFSSLSRAALKICTAGGGSKVLQLRNLVSIL